MPVLPSIVRTNVTSVLDHVGKHQDLGMTRLQVMFRNMDFELTEAAAESDVLVFCELLITKDDHAAVVEHIHDGSKLGFI